MSNVWIIRAGDYGEHQGFNLDNGLITIGWGEVGSLQGCNSIAAVKSKFSASPHYEGRGTRSIGQVAPQLLNFYKEIDKGDWIVMPLKKGGGASRFSAVGTVSSVYRFTKGNGLCRECQHRRDVKWLCKEIPNGALRLHENDIKKHQKTVRQIPQSRAESVARLWATWWLPRARGEGGR